MIISSSRSVLSYLPTMYHINTGTRVYNSTALQQHIFHISSTPSLLLATSQVSILFYSIKRKSIDPDSRHSLNFDATMKVILRICALQGNLKTFVYQNLSWFSFSSAGLISLHTGNSLHKHKDMLKLRNIHTSAVVHILSSPHWRYKSGD